MFIICLSPLSNLNIFVVRLDLVGLDWVGLNSQISEVVGAMDCLL